MQDLPGYDHEYQQELQTRRLLDAAEAFISTGRCLEPRKSAALCYRATWKQFKEILHTTPGVKLFFQGIMQLA